MIEIKGIKKLEKSELAVSKAGDGCWDSAGSGSGTVYVLCHSFSKLQQADALVIESPSLQS